MTMPELLAWARSSYAASTDLRDRNYYTGVLAVFVGAVNSFRCPWWRDPVNVPEYCYGLRDGVRMLPSRKANPVGRMRHGE